MKKILSLALMLSLILAMTSIFTVGSSAIDQTGPDWIITEICMDQTGMGEAGYAAGMGKDPFEFIEIYNNSGRTLNLYDYCLIYNGKARTSANFEKVVVESTPIKAGNCSDGSDLNHVNTSDDTLSLTDVNLGMNPETCLVEPGQVVVLWIRFYESYHKLFNDGKGLSEADFRAFYGMDENALLINFDGNSSTGNGGNDKNFNLKNKDTGTYGIALYTEAMQSANVAGGTYEVSWTECADIAAWATVAYDGLSSIGNTSWTFTINKEETDMRRLTNLTYYATPTPGRLSADSLTDLYGVYVLQGQTLSLTTLDYEFIEIGDKEVVGFTVDGTEFLGTETTYTATADGFVKIEAILRDKEVTTDNVTEAPTEQATEAPTEQPTEAGGAQGEDPTSDPNQQTAALTEPSTTAAGSSGCGSAVASGLAVIIAAAAAAVALKKKK